MTDLTDEQRPQYYADMDIGRTLAFQLMDRLVREEQRTPAQVGTIILHMHAILLASVPLSDRDKSIQSYGEAVSFMATSMQRAVDELRKGWV